MLLDFKMYIKKPELGDNSVRMALGDNSTKCVNNVSSRNFGEESYGNGGMGG